MLIYELHFCKFPFSLQEVNRVTLASAYEMKRQDTVSAWLKCSEVKLFIGRISHKKKRGKSRDIFKKNKGDTERRYITTILICLGQ